MNPRESMFAVCPQCEGQVLLAYNTRTKKQVMLNPQPGGGTFKLLNDPLQGHQFVDGMWQAVPLSPAQQAVRNLSTLYVAHERTCAKLFQRNKKKGK